jgi:DNA mismatch endonuclease, patch repair protein
MADMFTTERRSEIMGRITAKDTAPEILVRRLLHRLGFRFRLHRKDLPGKPDVVLPKLKTVVFIHGCFWHGHDCKKGSAGRKPKSNTAYWNRKLQRNVERDVIHAERLCELGWKRVVIWACETRNAERLEERLRTELAAT